MSEQTVAIIGYGTAGVNAIIGLRNAGYTGTIRVFSDTGTLPYSPILTSYYAGGMKSYEECFPWSEEELADLGAEVHLNEPVTALDPAAHLIRTEKGEYPYTKCLIACGAKAHTFGFPATDACTPYVLRTLDNAERLKGMLEDENVKRILISGASMIALKALEACLEQGKDVTLVGMNPHVLDFNALPETAARVEKGLVGYGVNLHLGTVIDTVEAADAASCEGRLKVTLKDGSVDYFDEIIVAHGVRSDFSFLAQDALAMDRAILVDEFMHTSDADIFAAGDVAQGTELISGNKMIVGIWKNAARQGFTAGAAMAAELAGGKPSPAIAAPPALATNTILIKDTLFISAGTLQLTDARHVEIAEDDEMTIARILEDTGDGRQKLVGFNIACDHDEPGGRAYDLGAMLYLRIQAQNKR